MKKLSLLFFAPVLLISLLGSCCNCMNCPGSHLYTGLNTDTICKEGYEASSSSATMSWAQYSDYMLQNGCTCVD
jgi:hypothetical protein